LSKYTYLTLFCSFEVGAPYKEVVVEGGGGRKTLLRGKKRPKDVREKR